MTGLSSIKQISEISSDLLRKYVDGCHILHFYGIVDAYGHLSVRLSDSTFLMSRYLAPALVATSDDLVIYDIESGEPVNHDAPRGM
jgi:hypothetical protein